MLLEAWNHEQKMLQKEQKLFVRKIALNTAESRKFKVTKSMLYVFTAICGLVGPSMAFGDLLWSCMAFYGTICPYIVYYCLLWPFYGNWQQIDRYRI